ncbi:peptidoglycan endopeptidase [Flavobacterium frigoris]|uniref:LysM domain-containing protein n=1 Tax=Flavobacterium frigoris TaxID=229204 RepID=A0A1H9F8K2_FLAFI|nr:peptidoglycan endopeptidase [Flavobacterium frigoris]SEQ33618.1 LysM domain-containing protein [Flavobacterium frigoris]
MRFYSWVFLFVLLSSVNIFSQEKYTEHTVSKGETISQIAAHYNIKPSAIYELNPDARKGIKFKEVLLIPAAVSKNKDTESEIDTPYPEKKHTVFPKETLYGIARQYGVAVEDLYKINPTLKKSGLKKGYEIRIPGTQSNQNPTVIVAEPIKEIQKNILPEKKITQKEEVKLVLESNNTKEATSEGVVREIVANETKYSIAKEYGITVADLNKANPILETEALKIGQKIVIPGKGANNLVAVVVEKEIKKESETAMQSNPESKSAKAESIIVVDKVVSKTETPTIVEAVVSAVAVETEVVREVLAKETKYGIAKEYGISVRELERQNPKIVKGLPIGYKLSIRSNKAIEAIVSNATSGSAIKMGNSDSEYNVKSFHGTDFLDQLVSTASENIGTRYRTGGTTKDGFDCSGLMCTTFGNFDIQLPRTSIEQSQYGVKIDNDDAQKGDLIFFKTNGRRQINHVGMVVEAIDGDIKFIHASVSGGVMISSIKEKYYRKKVSQINRVL